MLQPTALRCCVSQRWELSMSMLEAAVGIWADGRSTLRGVVMKGDMRNGVGPHQFPTQ